MDFLQAWGPVVLAYVPSLDSQLMHWEWLGHLAELPSCDGECRALGDRDRSQCEQRLPVQLDVASKIDVMPLAGLVRPLNTSYLSASGIVSTSSSTVEIT